jgi:hypothetical protein
MFALINCRLSPSAQAAFHSVLNRWRLRPDDPPRLDASGYLSVEFLGELRQALAPHCDLLALATTLMENKAESEE